jgi:hypothetical protein
MKMIAKLLSLALAGGIIMSGSPAKAAVTYFRSEDRPVLYNYITTIPPSRTVTFYTPGTALPGDVAYTELPANVTTRLVSPPAGDRIVYIGRNVYLIEPQKRVVVDALKFEDMQQEER